MFGAFGEFAFGEVPDADTPLTQSNAKGVGAFGEFAFGQGEEFGPLGAEIQLVADHWRWNEPVLSIRSGSRIDLPPSPLVFHDTAVRIAISATVTLPAQELIFNNPAPAVRSGGSVFLPPSAFEFNNPAVAVLTGARLDLPAAQIVFNSPAVELNARKRRVKTQIIQS